MTVPYSVKNRILSALSCDFHIDTETKTRKAREVYIYIYALNIDLKYSMSLFTYRRRGAVG